MLMPNFCTLKSLSEVTAYARRHMPNFYEMGPKLLSFSLLSELNYNVFKDTLTIWILNMAGIIMANLYWALKIGVGL